jgi:hypothetical protein
MMNRLPHVREPSSGEPDVCVHCLEEWVDLLTLYERDECSVRLRAALDAERAAVVAWLRELADAPETYVDEAIALRGASASIERGEHRREEE